MKRENRQGARIAKGRILDDLAHAILASLSFLAFESSFSTLLVLLAQVPPT